MHILFALIVYAYTGSSSGYVTRIGVYEKYAQCQRQGEEITGERGPFEHFRCVPVNG